MGQPDNPQQIPQRQPVIPAPTPAPNPAIYSNPVSVIGPQYCLSYPVDLAMVEEKHFSLHDKRTVLDPAGNPIVNITEQVFSAHRKHFVFGGDSTDAKDLLFTVARSSVIQLKTTLYVYLASNTNQDVCDFKVKGSWSEPSCIVYAVESKTIVAQMDKKETVGSRFLNTDGFTVTVYPNIDYAFIVALIVILDDINARQYCLIGLRLQRICLRLSRFATMNNVLNMCLFLAF